MNGASHPESGTLCAWPSPRFVVTPTRNTCASSRRPASSTRGTEAYDRGEKWSHYRKLPSLREYVLVSSQRIAVEVFRRGLDGEWIYNSYGPGERVSLPSLELELAVDAIYSGWAELHAAETPEASGGRL
ncbi:hypothetical protein LBMAG42_53040 [Deltaproteobacteria bacterium]|nr:hypothetical protein LBMAG42_53040 [Deltaproteobacteria bacterium]